MITVVLIEARKDNKVLKVGRPLSEGDTETEINGYRGEVSGFFRVTYREWPDSVTERIVNVPKF